MGFIVGFMFASSMAQKAAMQPATAGALPADHPPVGGAGGQSASDPQAMRAQVQASLEKARHAWAVLAWLAGKPALCPSDLETALGDLARL